MWSQVTKRDGEVVEVLFCVSFCVKLHFVPKNESKLKVEMVHGLDTHKSDLVTNIGRKIELFGSFGCGWVAYHKSKGKEASRCTGCIEMCV